MDWQKQINETNRIEIISGNCLQAQTTDYFNSIDKTKFYRPLLLIVLAAAACYLISLLALNIWVAWLVMALVFFKIIVDIRASVFSSSRQILVLRKTNEWLWVNSQGEIEALKLLVISKIFDSGILLKLHNCQSGKIHFALIWEHKANPEFIHYCKQLSTFISTKIY